MSNNPVKYVDPSGMTQNLPGKYSSHQTSSKRDRSVAIGAAVGTVLGAIIGGISGGLGGTLALPGAGTIAGAAAMGAAGATAGAAAGAVVGAVAGTAIDKVDEVLENIMMMSSNSNLKNSDKTTNRLTNPSKSESKIWRKLKNHHDGIKKSGSGRNRQYYKWDKTLNDIEVFDRRGNHLGSMDPSTGEMYKPPVDGRSINL